MNEKQYYYFGYGSNLDTKQMFVRCPDAQLVSRAVLKDYVLTFQGNGKRNVGNILPLEGEEVHGALYKINIIDMLTLDKYEGHPTVYKRELVTVSIGKNGRTQQAITYIMTNSQNRVEGMPEPEYFNKILRGFTQWGLPKIKLIQSLERLTGISSKILGERTVTSVSNSEDSRPLSNYVFVYGTLMQGFSNHRYMNGCKFIGRAVMKGEVYDMNCGFPAFICNSDDLEDDECYVYGELYEVPDEMMGSMDNLEGYYEDNKSKSMYIRERKAVEILDTGETTNAWVYIWNRELPKDSVRLPDGDWGMFNEGRKAKVTVPTKSPSQSRHKVHSGICSGCGERIEVCICN